METLDYETPRQRQFREDMSRNGYEVRVLTPYMGCTTYGVDCSVRSATEAALSLPRPSEVREATDLPLQRMGAALDEILYVRP